MMNRNNPFSATADTITGKSKATFKLLITSGRQPEIKNFTVMPCYVGNMYRISGQAALIPDENVSGTFVEDACSLVLSCMAIVQYVSAAALQNDHLEPSTQLIETINLNFDAEDMVNCIEPAVHNANLGFIDEYYGIFKKKKGKTGEKPKSEAEKLLDEMPHRTLGSMVKYFEGGISEWQLKWAITWDN